MLSALGLITHKWRRQMCKVGCVGEGLVVLNHDLQRVITLTSEEIIIHDPSAVCRQCHDSNSTRKAWWGLYGEPAPDLDIAISHGRLKPDGQERFNRQGRHFRGMSRDDGVDEVRPLALDGFLIC